MKLILIAKESSKHGWISYRFKHGVGLAMNLRGSIHILVDWEFALSLYPSGEIGSNDSFLSATGKEMT